MQNSVRIDKSVPMEMRDGTLLRGDIYRPDDKKKHPAILARTQYNRLEDVTSAGWNPFSPFMPVLETVWAGYAFVIQNIRGSYDSGGIQRLDDPYITIEGPDGYDSVEWVAGQPWCDGNVGMAGGSLLGTVQWVAAQENPPHLRAIAPWISGSGLLPMSLNGIFNLTLSTGHLILDGMELTDKLEKEGKDVSRMRPLFERAMLNPAEVYSYLPLKDVPQADFDVLREYWHNSVLNPSTTSEPKETHPRYEKITVPCLHVSGWYDFFTGGTFFNFNSMREKGGSRVARQGQHVLMGPWNHRGPNVTGETGGIYFGYQSSTLGSGIAGYNIAFFNKYLRCMDIDLPAVRYFAMGRDAWRNADAWPLPETRWQRFFLHSKGRANTSAGDGLLSQDEPADPEPTDIFLYDPHLPVPTTGCRGQGACGFASSPKDQSIIERRDDILCYTSPELKEDLEVTGPLELHLFAATSVRDTDFAAKLVDVYPNGYAFNVTDGIIRARYRKPFSKPEFITPGEVNEYIINMETASQLFRRGHRIHIDITSSNFPEYDRNMNTGNLPGEDAKGITAKQTIYHQQEYASYIDLPVIDSPS
jgi:putative CocE/NonD family hydrolase